MSKSERFSRKAYKKNKKKNRPVKNKNTNEKSALQTEIIKVMNSGKEYGISYKKTKKNIGDGTHKNNISAVNSLFKDIKITNFKEINEQKVMNFFIEQKNKYVDGDISKGGYITNKIKALQRFYDSMKVARGINEDDKKIILKNMEFVNHLNDWKKSEKIVKSKHSSRYLKPNSKQQKLINDRFHYLKNSRPNDKKIQVAAKYHRFSVITSARINQGVNATLKNLEKLEDGRYIYIVGAGEDKTGKPRIKFIDNKNDIKFLDDLVKEAYSRSDKNGNAYLFEVKDRGDNLSRQKIKTYIQEAYRENFKKYYETVEVKVRYQDKLFTVKEDFVPHSSRSISVQREIKSRAVKYNRDPKLFEKDLKEMIAYDISKGEFKNDPRGAIAWGYDKMVKTLGRELTVKEKSMYLTSCSVGHNRIDVMRDHYFSKDMGEWFREKGIK